MNTLKFHLLFICILFCSKSLISQTDNKLFFGEKCLNHSEILGEDSEYWVHLPMDYDKGSEKYPVLYITDGDEHFFLASGLIEFMSSQFMIPEFIVVAIFHRDRNHDLTPTNSISDINGFHSEAAKVSGGGEKLLQYIEEELIVEIESKYRASSYRVLAGHSLGGLFCIYVYLNRSDLFKGFISIDPAISWDNNLCERTLKSLPDQAKNFNNKLYISSAQSSPKGKGDKGPFLKSQISFEKELNKKDVHHSKFELFEKESHLTVPYQSLYAGLMYIFPDYYIFNDPLFTPEIQYIREYYKKVSDSYGMKVTPPEYLVEMIGKYYLFENTEYVKAIELFKYNTVNYPGSYKAFVYLGKAYMAAGDHESAIFNYKESLKLNPDNKDIQKILLNSLSEVE